MAFPKEFVDTDIDTTKNFKVSPRASKIPIDEPEGGNLNFSLSRRFSV